ncbi:MAG: DUF2723 domain-containing protein [Deltaproteobacteria bacterium]|nr:DUF2723 domain-containing protein [Deltaproteobacteria bacterium]
MFQTVLHCLGVPFQPGFPVYLILAWPFTWLAPLIGFAYSVHMFSAVFAAAACGVTALSIRRLGGSALAALAAGLALAFSYSLWSQATNAEVYAPHALFVALMLYFLFAGPLADESNPDARRSSRAFFAASVVYGLSFGVHPMTAANTPLYLYAALLAFRISGAKSVVTGFAAFAASGALPFLILPLLSMRDPYLVMGDVLSVRGFIHHVTMGTFVGNQANFLWSWERFFSVGREYFLQFFVLGVVLLPLGLWAMRRRRRALAGLLLAALPTALLAVVYVKGGEYDMWLIASYVPLAVIAGMGLDAVLSALREGAVRRVAAGGLAAAVVVPQLWINFPLLDRRHDVLPVDYGKNLMRNLDENAIYVVRSDSASSIIAYLQGVEDYRRDVTVIWEAFVVKGWYREYVRRVYGLDLEPERGDVPLVEAVAFVFNASRKTNRPLFFNTMPHIPPIRGVLFEPAGTMFKMVTEPSKTIALKYWDYKYTDPDWMTRPARTHGQRVDRDDRGRVTSIERVPYRQDAIDFQTQAEINLGNVYFAGKHFVEAADRYAEALRLIGKDDGAIQIKFAESLYLGGHPRAERSCARSSRRVRNTRRPICISARSRGRKITWPKPRNGMRAPWRWTPRWRRRWPTSKAPGKRRGRRSGG